MFYVVAYTPDDSTSPVYGLFWRGIEESQVNKLGTRDVEIVDELTPRDGEPVLYNWPFDIFRTHRPGAALQDQDVETVVLVGVSTGMAINVAAYQLAERFYNLIIPSDCITDGNRELHEAIIAGVMPVLGLVTTHDDVIAHLSNAYRPAGRRAAANVHPATTSARACSSVTRRLRRARPRRGSRAPGRVRAASLPRSRPGC